MLLKTAAIVFIVHLVNSSNTTCPKLLRELGNSQMKLIYCVTTNSVPVTMCTTCKSKYLDMLTYYDKLVDNCSSIYFDNDRINLVASTESVLKGLWIKAYCDDCSNNDNGAVFNKTYTSFAKCLNKFKNDTCEMCKSEYMELNNFYINLDQHNNGEVCYDLQDSMNRTRKMWSKELNCCRREYNMTLFTVALCIMLCLPPLFYSTTYMITARQERNYHVLTNEGPAQSTSRRTNINNPSQSMSNNHYSSASASAANNFNTRSSSPTLKPSNKNVNILNDDSISSDDDVML